MRPATRERLWGGTDRAAGAGLDVLRLRGGLGRFGTGVCVVTVAGDGRPARPHRQRLHGRLARPAARARLDRQAGEGTQAARGRPLRGQRAGRRAGSRGAALLGRSPSRPGALGGGQPRADARGRARDLRVPSLAHVRRRRPHAASSARSSTSTTGAETRSRTSRAASRRSRSPRWASSTSSRREGAPMGARTGREYVEALDERAIHVEIEGRAAHRPRLGDPPAPQRRPDVRRALRPAARPGAPRRDDLRVADHRRPRRHVVPPAAERRRRRAPARGDARLGRALVRAPRAHGRLLLEHGHGDGGRRRLVRPGRPRVRRERPPLLRARARERPAPDAHAGLPAGEPLRRPVPAAPPDPRRAHRRRERQRHRHPRRAHARDDRPVRGRDPRDAVDRPQGHRRRRPLLLRLRHPVRHARVALPLPRELRPRAQPLRPPARLAVRGDRRDRGLRRRARPVGAVLRGRAARAVQRDLHGDERRRPHDPPGRDADDGEDGVRPRPRLAPHRGDRDRAVPARPGEDRRGDRRPRDRAGRSCTAPRRARRRTASGSSRRPGGRSTRAGTGTRGRIRASRRSCGSSARAA